MAKVLLVCPPWQDPKDSSLALGTLKPILEAAGLPSDTLHASTLYPMSSSWPDFLNFFSAFLFAAHLYPDSDRETLVDTVVREYAHYNNASGILQAPDAGGQQSAGEQRMRARIWAEIDRAGIAIERCVERAVAAEYDIVGFSTTFETQVPAALAIARRLKKLRPELHIILGGAACFEEQGDGLATSFPELSAVCHTEGEAVIVKLVRALRGELALAEVPGIAFLDAKGALVHNPSPPATDLETLPIPEYDQFLEQYAASEWSTSRESPMLYFETSRGCWWGQKHLCSFCGLNADSIGYRKKSPARAFAEIETLYRRYPTVRSLQATDNILDMSYVDEVMPRLAAMEQDEHRPLSIFYEVKSNLRRDQIEKLARGGVTAVQPGIEAFSDDILVLMDKGATALQQARFVKWSFEAGISSFYNIILRNPGERAEWYDDATYLVSFMEQLPPPVGIVAMLLERFSPYFMNPSKYGIERVRPKAYYAQLYPDPRVDIGRIAYIFDYDHPILIDPVLIEAQRRFVNALLVWRTRHKPDLAFYTDMGDAILVVDRRSGAERRERITGVAADVFRYVDTVRRLGDVRKRFPQLDAGGLGCLLDSWVRKRIMFRDKADHLLGVLPHRGTRPGLFASSRKPLVNAPSRLVAAALT